MDDEAGEEYKNYEGDYKMRSFQNIFKIAKRESFNNGFLRRSNLNFKYSSVGIQYQHRASKTTIGIDRVRAECYTVYGLNK